MSLMSHPKRDFEHIHSPNPTNVVFVNGLQTNVLVEISC